MQEVDYLKQGKIILCPTDTIWGLSCDSLNIEAIERIKQIKGRDNTKSFILLVKDIDMLKQYVDNIPQCAMDIILNSPSPTTIIYPKCKNLPIEHLSFNESIGIRICKEPYIQRLLTLFTYPIVSSSANFSGEPSAKKFKDINPNLIQKVDFVASEHRNDVLENKPSKIYLINKDNTLTQIR